MAQRNRRTCSIELISGWCSTLNFVMGSLPSILNRSVKTESSTNFFGAEVSWIRPMEEQNLKVTGKTRIRKEFKGIYLLRLRWFEPSNIVLHLEGSRDRKPAELGSWVAKVLCFNPQYGTNPAHTQFLLQARSVHGMMLHVEHPTGRDPQVLWGIKCRSS